MQNVDIVILAGGKGTRMGADGPKVLEKVVEKPMITHILDNMALGEFTREPVVVVGYEHEKVRDAHPQHNRFAHQVEQKGTGHAVQTAMPHVHEDADTVVVFYGDHPLVSHTMAQKLVRQHASHDVPMTMATAQVTPEQLAEYFWGFGRMMRNEHGHVERIVESRDATEEELAVAEVNPAYFVFDKEWLNEHLEKIENNNAQGEIYLTDLVQMAFDQFGAVPSVDIEWYEALGANTPAQLAVIESVIVQMENE